MAEKLTKIYFVRHAETDHSVKDDAKRPLTAKGNADRKRVTAALTDYGITRAYSSPYARAFDTIKPFCDKQGLFIELVDDLRERAITDGWLASSEFDEFARRQWNDMDYKLDKGESANEVTTRNIKALSRILDANRGRSVVVGTHGMALSAIIHHFDNSFGYDGYEYIRPRMPYIICLSFSGDKFVKKDEITLPL